MSSPKPRFLTSKGVAQCQEKKSGRHCPKIRLQKIRVTWKHNFPLFPTKEKPPLTLTQSSENKSVKLGGARIAPSPWCRLRRSAAITAKLPPPQPPPRFCLHRCRPSASASASATLPPSCRCRRCCLCVTKLEYFGTYLRYLPTNPTSRHCDRDLDIQSHFLSHDVI
jgi:hypothetical protein